MLGDEKRADPPEAELRRSLLVGAMIGVALVAAVDEIVFHQLLGFSSAS